MRYNLQHVALFAVPALGWGVSWSYKPDRTADWYTDHRLPLPAISKEHSVASSAWGESQIFKLECIGCPFRVREYRQHVETWRTQDNSLALNFTIPTNQAQVLLNGEPIFPLDSRPPSVKAYQIPTNTSQETIDKMIGMHMLDDNTWMVGTKYGSFELQYKHTMMRTKHPMYEWLQFDVTGVHIRGENNPGSYLLEGEGQKMVQLLLAHNLVAGKPTLKFSKAQMVRRDDETRAKPFRMDCGKLAQVVTDFNPLEWDHYGKLGTWSHTWNEFWEVNLLMLIVGSIILAAASVVMCCVKRKKALAAARRIEDDPEAAALVEDCDVEYPEDAPPLYEDLPEILVTKPENL